MSEAFLAELWARKLLERYMNRNWLFAALTNEDRHIIAFMTGIGRPRWMGYMKSHWADSHIMSTHTRLRHLPYNTRLVAIKLENANGETTG